MRPERRAPQGPDALSREPRDPYRGRVLDGRYEILERIARGGMASVYAATDRRLDRTVAVKIMHPGLGDEPAFADRFVGEARAAARLSHPHVVSVFDQGEDDGVVFLAMELVSGHTLREEITRRSPMPPVDAVALLAPVVAALAHAHQAGLIHRDVKPENVLISDDGRIKVADFGLAKAITSVTQHTATGMLIGTVSYVAPEIVTEGRSDARGDVYAVGVILYELLTGHKPHAGETPIQIAYRHVHHDVPAPSAAAAGIPPYVDALVARATARDPEQRPSDARVLQHQLELVRHALATGVADDPALTADLRPRRPGAPEPTAELPPGPPAPPPLVEEQPEVAARVVDEDPWEHHALESILGAAAVTDTRAAARSRTGTATVARSPQPVAPAQPTQPVRRRPKAPAPPTLPVRDAVPRGATRAPAPPGPPGAPPRRRSRKGPIFLVLALVVAGVLGAGAWWFGYARYTSTPSVLGLAQTDAQARLDGAGLDGAVAERRFSDTVPEGTIISSDPEPGARSLDGGSVDLVVSLGVEQYDVPRLKELTEDQAQDAIAAANLTFGTSEQVFSETVPPGVVISSEPKAGTTVRPDRLVDLTVSQGREPIKVGSWTGKKVQTAERMLEKRGLAVETVEDYSDTVPADRVIDQQPGSSETRYRGDTVRLEVSLGPELIEVPGDLVASGVDDATAALEAAGFQVQTRKSSTYIGLGYVLSVDPGSGAEIPRGSTVVLSLV